jgi:hypothetical protein
MAVSSPGGMLRGSHAISWSMAGMLLVLLASYCRDHRAICRPK